jgi:hypothetical protein
MKHDNSSHGPGLELDEAQLAAVSGGVLQVQVPIQVALGGGGDDFCGTPWGRIPIPHIDPDPDPWKQGFTVKTL